mgnify:FL=1
MVCPCDENKRLFKENNFTEIGTSNRVESDFLPITGEDMTEKIDFNYLDTDSTRMPNDELERVDGEPYPTHQHIPREPYGEEPAHEPYLSEYYPEQQLNIANQLQFSIQEAWDESKHPRDADGKFGSGGGSSGGDSDKPNSSKPLNAMTMVRTTIQGQEYHVGIKDKLKWEKYTTPEQRANPNFQTDFGDTLLQSYAPDSQPAPEPSAGGLNEPVPEPEPTATDKPTRDIYKDLPEYKLDGEFESAADARKARKAVFADAEEDNGRLANMRSTVETQQRQIKYQQDMIEDRGGTEEPQVTEGRKQNIAALEESIAKLNPEIDVVEADLLKRGKLEYEEVQKYLHRRQEHVDDLTRRKEGSKKWYEDQGHIGAYDRVIDEYRTGKKEGHFAGAEADAHRAQVQKEYNKERDAYKKAQDEKNKGRNDKAAQASEDATKRLKASGLDSVDSINDLITADNSLLPSNEKAMTGNATDQKKFLKDTKSYLQDRADAFTIRTNELMADRGYVSTGIKQMYTEAKFKNDNFVESHSMKGVIMYNGGDKKQTAIYEKQFNSTPKIGQNEIKEVSIHASGQPVGSRSSRRGGVIMGSWDNKGKISLYHASGASRKKLERMGISKDDFDLTGDHEFAHATWHGTKADIKKTGQSTLSEAMDKFNASVNTAYDDPNFKLDSYTDTYRKGGSAGSFRRDADILSNETHSKLREYEKQGTLDSMENTANTVMLFQADYDKGGNAKARIDTKYGDMVGVGMAYGMTPTKAKFMQTMIGSYKGLRQEMYAV